jgi:hypothetical protein
LWRHQTMRKPWSVRQKYRQAVAPITLR